VAENTGCSVPGDNCSTPGCRIVRGLCRKHYQRFRKHGSADPSALKRAPRADLAAPMARRGAPWAFLQEALTYEGDECLLWPYGKNNTGYGQINYEGRPRLAHRLVVCLLTDTPLDYELHVAHAPGICHTPACINPRHLRWATVTANSHDKWIDGTMVLGENCRHSQLTRQEVWAIRQDGALDAVAALRYGVSRSTILDIRCGRTWKWLPNEDDSPFVPRPNHLEAAEQKAIEVINLIAVGTMNDTAIGRAASVSNQVVGAIRKGRTWKHLSRPWSEPPAPASRRKAT
jgi:hypothetical protein